MTVRSLLRAPEVQNKLIIGTGFSRTMTPDEGPLWVGNYKSDPFGPDVNAILTLHHVDTNAIYVGIWNGPLSARVGALTLETGIEVIPYVANTVTSGTDVVAYNGDCSWGSTGTLTNATIYFSHPLSTNNLGTVSNVYSFRQGPLDGNEGTITNLTAFQMDATAQAVSGDMKGLFIGAMSGITNNHFGIDIAGITGSATINVGLRIAQPTGGAANHCVYLTRTGTTAPTYIMDGGTSGNITVTTPATPTSWTLTLPPDDGDAGEQLQTNGSGVSTWEAAASTRDVKKIHSTISGEEALQRIRSAPVYRFHYDKKAKHVGGDYKTEFVGIVADEAPWAMMHNGRIFNPINAFGHAAAAIQALAAKVEALEAKVA